MTGTAPSVAADPCSAPANEIVAENCKPGTPSSVWNIPDAGDSSIQGFATDISVNQSQRVDFKVNTVSSDYRLDIYRMGYYRGDGARKVATVQPSVALPQAQQSCATDTSTGLVECSRWNVSASWTVPGDAVSGIYFAHLVREDGPSGESHIFFVVRDDDGRSDLLFQTSDTTWQAYNQYGEHSLYTGGPGVSPQHGEYGFKVSYDRPFTTRDNAPEDWVFNAEYPMVRWLERNGYDVSYFSGVDSDRLGDELLEHRAFLSVGHDEYWSATQRANVTAARDAGVNLAFFSGNEVFWKTRWEDNRRTLVTYKETHAGTQDRPDRHVDRHLARHTLRPARRWPAGERADRPALHRQRRRHDLHGGARRRGQAAVLAPHQHRRPSWRVRDAASRHARLRVGRGRRQRLPAGRLVPRVVDEQAEHADPDRRGLALPDAEARCTT